MPLRRAVLGLALALPAGPAAAIVGGAEGTPDSAVMVLDSRGGVCTGFVVAPGAVLTAGHCVAGPHTLRVHFRGPDGAPVLIEVAAKAVNPGYDAGAAAGRRRSIDLALLRTAEPLPGRFVPASLSATEPQTGDDLAVSGHGAARPGDPRSTGTYRSVSLPVVAPYGPSRILVWLRGNRGTGACQGDSGGGVARPDGAVLAVTAWIDGPCGGLTQAIRLGPQRDWIDRTLGGWGLAARWVP
jgi:hypothetical protein